MARALIVGCGCRGRLLGRGLIDAGWQVRGTSRGGALDAIAAEGIEPYEADPDRIGTLVDAIEGVTLIFWLLGSPHGAPEKTAALHDERLGRLLEEIVDTPVRGVVYELTGGIEGEVAIRAFQRLTEARERWRIPFEVVDADPGDFENWRRGMLDAAEAMVS
jgi:hypothetical protein